MGDKWKIIRRFFGQGHTDKIPSGKSGLELADALLAGLVTRKQVPGVAVKALYKGAEWFCQGYGFADLEDQSRVEPETSVFRTASISKPITAAALAGLVADGKLDLEEDIRAYVPEFPLSHGPVTLKQLASHTAGIRSYKGKEFALNRPMSIADSLELFKDDPLEFAPGTGYHYTSFDFVLLSLAMERAAGKPFHELISERVLQPLDMKATSMEIPGKPVDGQVAFYSQSSGGFKEAIPVDTRFKLAGGGYLSTVSDVCRFGQGILEHRIITGGMRKEFLSAGEVKGSSIFYGLGWEVSADSAGNRFYGHTGNAVGAYSNFKVFADQELVLALLINASVPMVQPVLDAVAAALHQSLPETD